MDLGLSRPRDCKRRAKHKNHWGFPLGRRVTLRPASQETSHMFWKPHPSGVTGLGEEI
ncbi:hypothetical protein NBRC116601_23440 [Cognatishimia sp. WU-CL00825]